MIVTILTLNIIIIFFFVVVVVVVVGIVVIVGGRGGDLLKEGADLCLVIGEIVVAGLLGLVSVVDNSEHCLHLYRNPI